MGHQLRRVLNVFFCLAMPFSTIDEPLGKSQFFPVWAGKVVVIIFATTCFVVGIPEQARHLTNPPYRVHPVTVVQKLALAHGGFKPSTLDYLELRFRNIDMPVADEDKIEITSGLLILLKATGHGRDALSAINDLDAFTWPDQQLRSTLMCCLQKIPDTIFCGDSNAALTLICSGVA